jgi:hypothetical protein
MTTLILLLPLPPPVFKSKRSFSRYHTKLTRAGAWAGAERNIFGSTTLALTKVDRPKRWKMLNHPGQRTRACHTEAGGGGRCRHLCDIFVEVLFTLSTRTVHHIQMEGIHKTATPPPPPLKNKTTYAFHLYNFLFKPPGAQKTCGTVPVLTGRCGHSKRTASRYTAQFSPRKRGSKNVLT